MAMTYRHRNGAVTAGDTWYLMALDGTLATPGPLTVPQGMNRITQIIVGFGDIAPTGAVSDEGYILKLTGVADGEAIINLGASTLHGTTKGNLGSPWGAQRYDVDIPVKPNAILSPYICATLGVDTSAPQLDLTLGFST